MTGRTTQRLQKLVLALYCIYAISPIYLSAMEGRQHFLAAGTERSVTVGIVWVNVLLTSLVDEDRGGGGAAVEAGSQGQEFILIRKKQALLNETFRIRPVLEEETDLSAGPDQPELMAGAFDVPPSQHFRHRDIPLSHHLGLSPPALLA